MSPLSPDYSRRRLAEASAALDEFRRLGGEDAAGGVAGDAAAAQAAARTALFAAEDRIRQLQAELSSALESASSTAAANTSLQSRLTQAQAAADRADELRKSWEDAEHRAAALKEHSSLLEAEAVRLDTLHRAALRAADDAEARGRSVEEALKRDLRAANAALDRAAAESGAESIRVKSGAEDLRRRLEEATARLQAFETEKRLDLARGSGDAAALHIELQRAMASAAAVRRELAQTREEAAGEVAALHRQIDALRSGGRLAELESQLGPLQERAESLAAENARLDDLRRLAEREAAAALAQVQAAGSAQEELAQLKERAAQLEIESATMASRCAAAEEDAAVAARRVHDLNSEIAQARDALTAAREDAEALRRDKIQLEDQNLQSTRRADQLLSEIAEFEEHAREAAVAAARARTVEESLRRQLAETKEAFERAQSRATTAAERLAAAQDLLESMKARTASLEEAVSRQEYARGEAETQASSSAADAARLRALLSAAEDAVAPLDERAKSLAAEVSRLRERCDAAQAEAVAAQAERSRLAGATEELRSQLTESQIALEAAATEVARADERFAVAQSEIVSLRGRLSAVEGESAALDAKLQDSQGESSELAAYGKAVEESMRAQLEDARAAMRTASEIAVRAQMEATQLKERAQALAVEAENQSELRRTAEGERCEISAYGRAVEDALRRELEEAQLSFARATQRVGAAEATVTSLKERSSALEQSIAFLEQRLKAAESTAQRTTDILSAEKLSHSEDIEAWRRELDEAVKRSQALDVALAQMEERFRSAENAAADAVARLNAEKQARAADVEALRHQLDEALKRPVAYAAAPAPGAEAPIVGVDEWPQIPGIDAAAAPAAAPDFSSPPVEPLLDPGWSRLIRLVRPPVEAAYAHLRRLSATAMTNGQKALLRLSAASMAQASDALGSVELSLTEGPSAAAPASLVPTLEAALAAWEPTFRRRGVGLFREWSGSLPAVAHDPRELRVLVYHVLRNVLEAAPSGARLAVRGSRGADGGVRVEFSDDGPGFPAAWLERRFEPFAFPRRGRAGLGLALVRRTLRRWGADAEASNGPGGRGAKLTWIFPPPEISGAPES